jgi:galactosylgalactosylxylosylprotein 3-beta-glucuronosyltransferase 3
MGFLMFCLGAWIHSMMESSGCITGDIYQTGRDFIISECNCKNNSVQDYLPEESNASLPIIFMITPTYSNSVQKPDLTRLCQTLMHIKNIHWIVVEDSEKKTTLVSKLLHHCTVPSTHLNIRTSKKLQKKGKLLKRKNRGSEQRNLGIRWLKGTYKAGEICGVVYFGDDDNTYDLRLFQEMRYTKRVSVWPVGIVGGLLAEGPICRNGKVVKWHTSWDPNRAFPIDMAGFAVNLDLLLSYPKAEFEVFGQPGYLEPNFLKQIITKNDLEAKAEDCTKIFVWHTQTKPAELMFENKHPSTIFDLTKR